MKQVHPSYSFVASTKTITLTGLNIDQDQLLLIVNATRGVQYFNFADSSLRATVTSGANTTVVLTDASTTGHANGDALVVYYDDQAASQVVSGTVTANPGTGAFTVSGTVGLDNASLVALENITVTVANTVTVALDANSLSALENVTVTVGSSISGTVTVSNIDFAAANNDGNPSKAVQLGFLEQAGSGDFKIVNNDTAPFPVQGFGKSNVNDGTFYQIPVCESGNNDYLGRHIPIGFQNYDSESTIVGSNNPLPISGTVTASASNLPVYNHDEIPNDKAVGITGKVFVANDYDGNNGEILIGKPAQEFITGQGRVGVELINKSGVSLVVTGPALNTWVSNTVTANVGGAVNVLALPSGALTTRFGSVTTANTAQITSAVTNASRKYLLAQNISAGTVTIGIGFSPTTTKGIQLTAGAGLTFDAFCPTGAVYWLGAVTGSAYTILEG